MYNINELLINFIYAKSSYNKIKFLLDYINVDTIGKRGITPIMEACQNNNFDLIKLLIQNGADTNKVSDNKRTVFSYLAKFSSYETIKFVLVHGTAIKIWNRTGSKKIIIPEIVITGPDIYGKTPLHYACYYNNKDAVKIFINNGCDVNKQDENLNTPLHLTLLSKCFYKKTRDILKIVKILRKFGAKSKILNNDGKSPIDIAHEKKYEDIIFILSELDLRCRLPFLICTRNRRDQHKIFYSRTVGKEYPYCNTTGAKDFKDILTDAIRKRYSVAFINLLLDYFDINYVNKEGLTPLMVACLYINKPRMIEFLIIRGANLNFENSKHQTFFSCLCYSKSKANTFNVLKNKQINFKLKNSKQQTFLHLACKYNNEDAAYFAVDYCKIDEQDHKLNTAFHITIKKKEKLEKKIKTIKENNLKSNSSCPTHKAEKKIGIGRTIRILKLILFYEPNLKLVNKEQKVACDEKLISEIMSTNSFSGEIIPCRHSYRMCNLCIPAFKMYSRIPFDDFGENNCENICLFHKPPTSSHLCCRCSDKNFDVQLLLNNNPKLSLFDYLQHYPEPKPKSRFLFQ